MTASPIRLSAEDAQQARDMAWDRYVRLPHADIRVGWDRYLREIEEIDRLAAMENDHG